MINDQSVMEKLLSAIELFVNGHNRSQDHAEYIVGIIVENFYEDERFEELMELLATYRPEGGDYLYNEEQALKKCEATLTKIKSMGS